MKFLLDPQNLMLLGACVVSGAMLVWPLIRDRASSVKSLSTIGATRLINSGNPVLLDVRETAEYQGGRLPNAIHIPLSQLKERAGELAKYTGRPVVAYCERGQRSRSAASSLAGAGFTDVYELAGGIRAWKEAGLPVESGT
ncbi:MAG: rhodanese-like domain-containing protein [Proteobacteria bacterium]|nr:rhodanese-like domain-containing protein [Pseudomonadota bacterium]